MKRILLSLFLLTMACTEAPIEPTGITQALNNPVSIVLIPGTDFGVVASANVSISEANGSLVAFSRSGQALLFETQLMIPSFAGRMAVDPVAQRIYIADRGGDALLVYSYQIPGEGGLPISFAPVDVPLPQKDLSNGIQTDEDPYDVRFIPGLPGGDTLFVTNATSGSVSVIPTANLSAVDLDPIESLLEGLPLISSQNFENRSKHPGAGANRMTPDPTGRLLFITSTSTAQVYLVDAFDRKVEAMIDLSVYLASGGTRGIAIRSNGTAYVVSRGQEGMLVLDATSIVENGIDQEVVEAPLRGFVSTGRQPDGLVLSSDEQRVFVANEKDDSVTMVDAETLQVLSVTFITGHNPAELVVDADQGVIYVLNFLSNSISILDEITGLEVGTMS